MTPKPESSELWIGYVAELYTFTLLCAYALEFIHIEWWKCLFPLGIWLVQQITADFYRAFIRPILRRETR